MFKSYTPWKHQKTYILGGVKWEQVNYTKQIIDLSGPVDETSFFARDRFILVLRQKGDPTTRYLKIIWYARLPLKCTNMYLFTDKISAINLMV